MNTQGRSRRKWLEQDSVFFKIQGHSSESLAETASIVKDMVEQECCIGFVEAGSSEEADEIWDNRKNACEYILQLTVFTTSLS
jgi:D-lactate dehydrogenase (cytochrome)